jgi:hypothetical protein
MVDRSPGKWIPIGKQFPVGGNRPGNRSHQLENLLKERIPWKEPERTTVLTG